MDYPLVSEQDKKDAEEIITKIREDLKNESLDKSVLDQDKEKIIEVINRIGTKIYSQKENPAQKQEDNPTGSEEDNKQGP